MSGITLTPVVATPVSVVAEVAANGSPGFDDALGAAMAQLTGNASVADDAALQMADRGPTLVDASSETDAVASVAPGSPDAYAQLMMAMAQLINHGNAREMSLHGAVAPDSSLSEGLGRKSMPRLQSFVARDVADERESLPLVGGNTSLVELNDVEERHSGANFAALLQDLPVDGSKSKATGHDLAQPAGVGAALNHSGVIEVRQHEGRKELVISTPVSSAGWGEELGSKTLVMVRDGQQSAEMQLNPPNLGPLEVRLSVQNDQTSLIFVSAHASVRDAIQSALPRLSGMLAESGLSMGSVQVGDQSLAQQQQQRNGGNDAPRRFARAGGGELDGVATVADAIPLQRASWRLSMFV